MYIRLHYPQRTEQQIATTTVNTSVNYLHVYSIILTDLVNNIVTLKRPMLLAINALKSIFTIDLLMPAIFFYH